MMECVLFLSKFGNVLAHTIFFSFQPVSLILLLLFRSFPIQQMPLITAPLFAPYLSYIIEDQREAVAQLACEFLTGDSSKHAAVVLSARQDAVML